MNKIVFLLSLLIFSILSQGQNNVTSVKDRKGNIWFTVADRAVYRYDGKAFVNFTKESYGSNINLLSCLYEDRNGNLWFTTDKGLCYYDGKKFIDFKMPLPAAGIVGDEKYSVLGRIPIQVTDILQDKTGCFWFLTWDHGAYRYDPRLVDSVGYETSFTNFLVEDAPNCIMETKKGDIFIGSWNGHGVFRFDMSPEGKPTFKKFGGFSDGMISDMLEDKAGNMWVGTRNAAADRYDGSMNDGVGQRKAVTNFSSKNGLTDNTIYCVYEDSKGNIWLGADVGNMTSRGDAFCYDGKSFTNVTENAGITKVEGFVYGIKSIIEDNAGNMWLGSKGGLLLCYDGRKFIDFSEKITK